MSATISEVTSAAGRIGRRWVRVGACNVLGFQGTSAMSAAAEPISNSESTPAGASDAPPAPALKLHDVAASAEAKLDALQRELDSLQNEIEVLKHRDSSLRYYMHALDEELKLAARLQRDFLPKSLPSIGPVRFHSLFRPAGHVSGDLFDVMRLDEAHTGFYVADAVGHGMPAALLTMFLKQALVTKEITPAGYRLLSPDVTMSRLNEALVEQNLSHATFATALYGHVSARTLKLTFAKGGHPSPLLLTKDGEMRSLEADGSLLGIFGKETFESASVQLSPGDRVFIYTDGIEQAFSAEGLPDADSWRRTVRARGMKPTIEIMAELTAHIDNISKAPERKHDDVALIVVEVAQ
jgi:sigma-B regulation protein RsbU (phosphoserine phosphatase)